LVAGGGPIEVATAGAGRSLRLAQRIISGFVQALDFGAVEVLVANLQPRAQSLGVRKFQPRNGWLQPLSQSVGSSRVYSSCALPGTVLGL
jgi:hypothetical protein